MVVLSRPRSSHKVGTKLSVPPPLNLPSLRKEHEKFDTLGAGSGTGWSGGAGTAARPSSSGMGWSKPSAVVTVERNEAGGGERSVSSEGVQTVDRVGVGRGGIAATYMPPSARGGYGGRGADVSVVASVEKASVLRGEDFPSLKATLSVSNGQTLKQKESAHQKHKQGINEEPSTALRVSSQASSQVVLHPQVQASQSSYGTGVAGSSGDYQSATNSRSQGQARKQDEFFPSPLPLVRLNPRSDWADDERDTSHGLTDRSRDSRTETYWDRDFEYPRSSFMPNKSLQNHFDRRGQRDDDVGKNMSNEVSNAGPFARDGRVPSREGREGHMWRNFVPKDGFASQNAVFDRNNLAAKPINVNREAHKENKYIPPQLGGNTKDEQNNGVYANRDLGTGRRDQSYGYSGRHHWNNSLDANNGRGAEKNYRERYFSDSNRYRGDSFQNNMGTRYTFPAGNKGLSSGDHLSSFIRDKRSLSKNEKPYVEDPFMGSSGFDGQDPFSGGILGVVKRKKDANKPLDFHDPVRESFEAELERVQKIQEQERQRVIEEQERALEIARREEEERMKALREQEERQRRLEEEAREAAWRADQERVEADRKAEELRIAREEEKQRLSMEEERRKQAAKQKLLELEERIARRQSESADGSATIPGDIMASIIKDRDVSRADDFTGWEDGERMVERITNSASSDSSLNRPFDVGSRVASARDGSFAFTDRGKPYNSWRRDIFENGNSSSFFSAEHDSDHHSPRRDTAIGGRSFPRKDFYGGQGYMPTRGSYRGVIPDPHIDDFSHPRGHRWNIPGEGDHYGRSTEFEAEFQENTSDKFDLGWGQGQGQGQGHSQGRGRGYSPFPERLYPNSDLDELYSYGRSRYPARQPRVLPPPALPSVHRASFRSANEHTGSAAYEERSSHFSDASQRESTAGNYQNVLPVNSATVDVQEQSAENVEHQLNGRTTPGCDSQSSLSVSSPPSSPTQLSHDDFDESRESLVGSSAGDCQDITYSENAAARAGRDNTVTAASSISIGDDEDWTVENNGESQEQEEYEEDVGYHEDDELHEGDDENVELTHEFEQMHLEEKSSSDMMDNLVLGFDQGVEVGIPNDDYEKNSRIDESAYAGTQGTVDVLEQESFDGYRDGQTQQDVDTLQHMTPCSMVEDKEKGLQNNVSVPNVASAPMQTSSDHIDAGDSASSSILHAQQSTLLQTDSQSSGQAAPSVSGVQGSAELPVKLQFGLFTGPSLIPSPIPAIQIGSIQMPLQLHPHIGPALPHMHASQPPVFQFGQLRYPAPMSQGILPLAPQSISYVQPNVPQNYSSSQVPGGALSVQTAQDSSFCGPVRSDVLSFPMNSHQTQAPNQLSVGMETESKHPNELPATESKSQSRQNQVDASKSSVDEVRPEPGRQTDRLKVPHIATRNDKPAQNKRVTETRLQGGTSSQYASNPRHSHGSSAHQFPGSKGRRHTFLGRNSGARSSFPANEATRGDTSVFHRRPRRITQRYEFRVRQTAADGKQAGLDGHSSYDVKGSEIPARNGMDKELKFDQQKQTSCLTPDKLVNQETVSGMKENKPVLKEAAIGNVDSSPRVEGSLKRNISSEDDVDAPLQSGVVRVYQQPGIEVPSDEDDFIEVRSKRQMLNDRREQREKEIKAKSVNTKKPQRKSRPASQSSSATRSTSRSAVSSGAQAGKSMRGAVTKQGSVNNEQSTAVSIVGSQPKAPIGVMSMSQADIRVQAIKPPLTSSYAANSQVAGVDSNLVSDAASKINRIQSSLGSWGSSGTSQPVMALTQSQLEEAMKPACFDTNIIADKSSSAKEPILPSSSVPPKDSRLSSATSPISSLLAGEKIQFGAVTSPTVLPPSTRVVSQCIRPASSSLDIQMSQSMSVSEGNREMHFEKAKHVNESCRSLDDCEAEAEAAASAVAVAALGNDEGVGSVIGSCSTSISDSKSLGSVAVSGIAAGMSGQQRAASQSKAEETLSVSLPADLSVETPPISIWPPLPSPHNSSGQMLPPFPGAPTSHLMFYDMNPMMGGPVFAFAPSEESAGTHSQPQKNVTPSSGPLGTWQQCPTGVDSFYGPPTGFTAPFITPPGSISGVQGPQHMVVYNHFAPVGQFGQVGLSYMGTTYVPSGKQPDWKHNPTSTAMGGGEGEMNNLNMVSVHRNAPAPQVQHLAPGSPLLSMASPMAMFEVSPFQPSPDMSIHPRWSHVQASSVHAIPQSIPLQQQPGVAVPSQFSHGSADHHALTATGFSKPLTSLPVENGRSFDVAAHAGSTQFPNELGVLDPPILTVPEASALAAGNRCRSGDSASADSAPEGSVGRRNSQTAVTAPHKAQPAQKNGSGQQHYNHYQRGQRNSSEWSNRKMGFNARNNSSSGDRSYPPSKVKQVYVAKQSTTGSSTAV